MFIKLNVYNKQVNSKVQLRQSPVIKTAITCPAPPAIGDQLAAHWFYLSSSTTAGVSHGVREGAHWAQGQFPKIRLLGPLWDAAGLNNKESYHTRENPSANQVLPK